MLNKQKLSITMLSSLMMFYTTNGYANTFEKALKNGEPTINVRYRYEGVDDSVNTDAKASTLRTRLGYSTSKEYDLSAHVDFEHITRIALDDYNSTQNGRTAFARVVDPSVTELNQAFLLYSGINDAVFQVGRQRMIFDNARFVGNVGWRQNEQTFDALRYDGKFGDNLKLTIANIQKVLSITSTGIETNHNLINFSASKLAGGKLTAYAYLLDYDSPSITDSATYGLRYKGSKDNFLYTLELARQGDYSENNSGFSTNYIFGELGYKFAKNFKAFLAYESLGSDGGAASFQTPLATKHAFNGWVDKFLATPADGLIDVYVKAVAKVAGLKLVGVYHDYSSDEGSSDYGSEIDLLIAKKFNNTFTGLIKYADYQADDFSQDTNKLWVQVEMKI